MHGTLSLRGSNPDVESCVLWDTDDRQSLALSAAIWDESACAGFSFYDGESLSFLSPALIRDGFDPAKIPKATIIVAPSLDYAA